LGLQEDIFKAFFSKLEDDKGITKKVVDELRRLWESNELASEERILKTLDEEIKDVGEGENG